MEHSRDALSLLGLLGLLGLSATACVTSTEREGDVLHACPATVEARWNDVACDFEGSCSSGGACPSSLSCVEGRTVLAIPRCLPPDAGPDAPPPPPPDAAPDAPPPPPDAAPDAPPPPPDAAPDAPPPPPRDAGPDAPPPPPRDGGPDAATVWTSCEDFIDLGGRAGERCDPGVFAMCRRTTACCTSDVSCTAEGRVILMERCLDECPGLTCPGYSAPTPGATPCTSEWMCGPGQFCLEPGAPYCGDVCEVPSCASDADCDVPGPSTRTVCEVDPTACGCGSPVTRCRPACQVSGCMADEVCVDSGHCRPLSCEADGYACPASHSCRPAHRDADRHGCVRRPCSSDAQCDCGSCIHGLCFDGPGFCAYAGG